MLLTGAIVVLVRLVGRRHARRRRRPLAPPLAAPRAGPGPDPLREALAAYRARGDDASLDVLRGVLFARAGAAPGATFADALRALGFARSAARPDDGRRRAGALRTRPRARAGRARSALAARCLSARSRAGRMSTPHEVRDALARTIVGQREVVDALVMALLADGHVLLEGMPGVAKTLACRALAAAVGGIFKRVQFTPDLLPSDIVGTRIFDQRSGEFVTVRGPLFANIVLADEINRAPAKVQSALLEGMQERRATIGPDTLTLAAAVRRTRHDEPVRRRRNLRVAAGAARPLLAQRARRLSVARGRAHDRRPLLGGRGRTGTRRCDLGRRRALAGRGARGALERTRARLCGRFGAGDARREVRRLGRESAGGAGVDDSGAGPRLSRRPHVRGAGRRARARTGRAAPSRRFRLPLRDRRRRRRYGAGRDHRERSGAMNPLRAAIVRSARHVHAGGTVARGARPGDGYTFDRLRGYAEGDDPRRIDWSATARIGSLQTRVYLEETVLVLGAVIDESPSMRLGRKRVVERGRR